MMDIGTIVSLAIAGVALLWSIYRDKSSDTEDLQKRVSTIETKVVLAESTIERLETEQDEMKKMLKSLENQINQMNLKVEKILTILENTKGA
ncbi:hypothetical protein [Pseudescherichia vulneris]|nr:hypothetical protein [Pseudescherichia vulneris]